MKFQYGGRTINVLMEARENSGGTTAHAVAQQALDDLHSFDLRAREFLATRAPSLTIEALDAVDVFYPHADWVRARGPDGRSRQTVFDSTRPACVLVYTLVNDRNVVDVIFNGKEPYEADYH